MLNVRCGITGVHTSKIQDCEWPVLRAAVNPNDSAEDVVKTISQANQLHIFASPMAFHFFQEILNSLDAGQKKKIPAHEIFACGVGNATDTAARSLKNTGLPVRWTTPDLAPQDRRENGMSWTLEQLEKRGFIPRHPLHLWTKTFSTSEKILRELKSSRQWNLWETKTHEIYSLSVNADPFPPDIVLALANKSPICFGVKSAEVLDATVTLLLQHTRLTSAQQLPRSVHFSVWEKGALQKAQQLFLHSRLIPWSSFEPHTDPTAES